MPDVHLPVRSTSHSEDVRAAIATDLRELITGEVLFQRHERMLYSTDASIYQVEPIGVVVPRSIVDAERVVAYCHEHEIAILPRGGGTSLAGQTVNRAIVIDFSASCTNIIELDAQARTATVEPGVVLAQLNRELQKHGLLFGPDVATATHACIGGMIGNNSAGAHSILYGRTVENLLGLDTLLADGRRVLLQRDASTQDELACNLTQQVADVVLPLADAIDARFPKNLRHVGGYNLDLILQQLRESTPGTFDAVNLAHLLCGSEGTLGVTVRAKLKLVEAPRAKGLMVLAFEDVDAALAAVPGILETQPAAVELVDDVVIGLAKKNIEYRQYVQLMPGIARAATDSPGVVLYVEYYAMQQEELECKLDALQRAFPTHPVRRYTDPEAMVQAWKLRAAGEPLLYGLPGLRKPVTFVEDAAVDPARLGEFIREFRLIVQSHDTTAAFYAHASVGCLHVRPMINLRDPADRDIMRDIASRVADLAVRYGGTHSGEHGDGRLRSHLLEQAYGRELCEGFRAIKAIFDPHNRMNPGNIVQPPDMLEHLRVQPDEAIVHVPPIETYFRYDDQGGFGQAVEMCNGAGVCRRRSGGTMCPSYRATLQERHATRGRGNALRLAISGQLSDSSGTPAWNDAETLETLDLCLSCKACKSECPSNVDVSRLKAEYLAHSFDSIGGPPLSTRAFGRIRSLNRMGSAIYPLANAVSRLGLARFILQRVVGVDRRRSLPRFEQSLYRWFASRPPAAPSSEVPTVVLFPDCFTVYNEPHIGQAAVTVLEALGYRVFLPRLGCCGRSMISNGMLAEAQRQCRTTAEALLSTVEREHAIAVLGCEPSCISAIVDDWQDLKLDVDRDRLAALAEMTFAIEDFIERRWSKHPVQPPLARATAGAVLLHGHCHQKALWGTGACESLLSRACGDDLRVLDAGCCGMAGGFGYTTNHFDVSMRIGELELLPAVRNEPKALVLAPGTSCRHQIKDATGRIALHPIEALCDWIKRGQ